MDKTIYLPTKAINNITKTKKHIVFRQSYYQNFKPSKDALVLINADNLKTIGVLKTPIVYLCKNFIVNWWKLRKKIAYIEGSLWSYIFTKRPFFVYVFTNFVRYK